MITYPSKAKILTISLICIITFAAFLTGYAQQGIKIAIEKVNLDLFPEVNTILSVSSPQGLPIGGLSTSDFSVFEDSSAVTDFEVTATQDMEQQLTFVLVMDTSGSMHGTAIADSIAAAKKFVASLNIHDEVGVITFADEVTVVQEPVAEKSLVLDALDTLTAGGNTLLYDALYEGIELLREVAHRKVLILVTDGVDSQLSIHTPEEIINEAVRLGIPIGTIGFGAVDAKELQRISTATGALSQIAPDSSTLDMTFARVLQLLRQQYLLRYTSTIPIDGMAHELMVTIEIMGQPFTATTSIVPKTSNITISLPNLSNGQAIGGIVPVVPITASPAPIVQMEISLDGSPLETIKAEPFEFNWDTNTVSEGPHELKILVVDSAGNRGEMVIDLLIEKKLKITIETPTEGEELSDLTQIQLAVDSKETINNVVFFVDGEIIDSRTSPPYVTYFNVTDYPPGTHQIVAVATDVNGNYVQDAVQVEVRPPIVLSFITPLDGEKVSATADIQLDADSLYRIQKIIFQLNNKEFKTLTEPPWETKFPFTIIKPGTYLISAMATDQQGHFTEKEITIEIQGIPPLGWAILGAALLIIATLVTVFLIKRRRSRLV